MNATSVETTLDECLTTTIRSLDGIVSFASYVLKDFDDFDMIRISVLITLLGYRSVLIQHAHHNRQAEVPISGNEYERDNVPFLSDRMHLLSSTLLVDCLDKSKVHDDNRNSNGRRKDVQRACKGREIAQWRLKCARVAYSQWYTQRPATTEQ